VIKINIGGVWKVWYEKNRPIETCLVEDNGNIIRHYENSSRGNLIPRINALLKMTKKLTNDKKWGKAHEILEKMGEKMDKRVDITYGTFMVKFARKRYNV
jgi:hypothetical protein